MDERSPEAPAPDPSPLAAATAHLSPVQQAYGKWVAHSLVCPCCRDADRGRCEPADQLWQAYQRLTREAFGKLARVRRADS